MQTSNCQMKNTTKGGRKSKKKFLLLEFDRNICDRIRKDFKNGIAVTQNQITWTYYGIIKTQVFVQKIKGENW